MFKNAIVRMPGQSVIDGIDDYARALAEHQAYVKALESLGVKVTVS